MDGKVRYFTRVLRAHDRELYAVRDDQGIISVLRKRKRFQAYELEEGITLSYLIPSPEFVVALTDNWTKAGHPLPYGADAVLDRIRQIDGWARENLIEEMDRENERIDEVKRKDFRNNAEAFFADTRREFARATNEINTSTLDKSEKRRRLRDEQRKSKHA